VRVWARVRTTHIHARAQCERGCEAARVPSNTGRAAEHAAQVWEHRLRIVVRVARGGVYACAPRTPPLGALWACAQQHCAHLPLLGAG
jgi:hypothetical protein